MIKVTVELDVLGLGRTVKRLCTVRVYNDGSGTETRGNYGVKVFSKTGKLMRKGKVLGWPRKSKHVVDLIAAALRSVEKP